MFDVYDKYCSPDLDFLDIGVWNGCTAIYASRISRRVYAVEADKNNAFEAQRIASLNAFNIFLMNRALYTSSNQLVSVGRNLNPERAADTSQCHIHESLDGEEASGELDASHVMTISLKDLLELQGDNSSISIVKIDIEGGEEAVNEDIMSANNVNRLVNFHLWAWKDKDIDRFSCLPDEVRQAVKENPSVTIMFPKASAIIY